MCHEGVLADKTRRLFAVWCAREDLKLVDNPDPKIINAIDVADRHASGLATDEELAGARDDVWNTKRAAAFSAVWGNVLETVRCVTRDAGWGDPRVDSQLQKLKELIEQHETMKGMNDEHRNDGQNDPIVATHC